MLKNNFVYFIKHFKSIVFKMKNVLVCQFYMLNICLFVVNTRFTYLLSENGHILILMPFQSSTIYIYILKFLQFNFFNFFKVWKKPWFLTFDYVFWAQVKHLSQNLN